MTDALVAQREKQKDKEKLKGKHHIDPALLSWKPPVFKKTWNW